ncbi:protein kinase domain-containing protein [Acanthopleuribacter pedis]|uniref:mitogen-activated protein kinase kinase n=1 Tax=Acanthopleuribacter pedis TaxID=442870 RepID=A0A8J7Q3K0_9BACT|nr:protein kinase [Acanthopleuribacter pedis]MBO1319912.1 protein kinase [Acanthopleuribacter pedis]
MHLSFNHKVLFAILFVTVLLTASMLFFLNQQTSSIAQDEIRDRLQLTHAIYSNYQQRIAEKLKAVNTYVSGNAAFQAYMIEAIESNAPESAADQFSEIQRFSGAEFMLVLNEEGGAVVDTSGEIATNAAGPVTAMVDALITRAEQGEEPVVIDRLYSNGKLYDCVLSPLSTPDGFLAGFVIVGYQITDATAAQIGGIASCNVVFLVNRPSGELDLAAQYFKDDVAVGAMRSTLESLAEPADQTAFEIHIQDVAFKASATDIVAASGKQIGRLIILKSLANELAPFRSIQFGMIIIAAIALVFLVPISLMVARQVTRPVSLLVNHIEQVRQGDYGDAAILVDRHDEIGTMANAFRELVRELREQQELIQFLERAAQEGAANSGTLMDSMMATLDGDPTQILGGNEITARTNQTSITSQIHEAVMRSMETGRSLPSGFALSQRYEVISELGRGGMGVVYKVKDHTLDEVVAVKMLLVDRESEKKMMIKETKLARRVTHRNVIRIYDLGEIEGVQFISMEFVTGETLKALLKKVRPLPLRIGIRILSQVCEGLRAAHEEGVVHGDIKPENIMLNTARGVAKVMDFGVSRIAKGDEDNRVTGTPTYMAPEQFNGEMSPLSDIYAIGIMAFEMFTGKRPFKARTMIELLNMHLNEMPPAPRAINPNIPEALEALIFKAIAKEPGERFTDLAEMRKALKQIPTE